MDYLKLFSKDLDFKDIRLQDNLYKLFTKVNTNEKCTNTNLNNPTSKKMRTFENNNKILTLTSTNKSPAKTYAVRFTLTSFDHNY